MKVKRVWVKPAHNIPGQWRWEIFTNGRFAGEGSSVAEAKADRLCNLIRCGFKHAKPHQPKEIWKI